LDTILRVRGPKQQCHSTEEQWLVNHVKGHPTRLSSLKGKEKDVAKNIYYSTMKIKDRIEALA